MLVDQLPDLPSMGSFFLSDAHASSNRRTVSAAVSITNFSGRNALAAKWRNSSDVSSSIRFVLEYFRAAVSSPSIYGMVGNTEK